MESRAETARRGLELYREAYFGLTEALTRSDTLEGSLAAALAAAATPLHWELGAVWLLEDERLRCRAAWSQPPHLRQEFCHALGDTRLTPGSSLAGEAIAGGGLVWRGELSEWRAYEHIETALELGLRAAVALPILGKQEPIGVIEFLASRIEPPDELQAATLKATANQLGLFLGRERAEASAAAAIAELERSNAELEQFAYVACHDLQEPLRAIAGFVQLLQRRYQGQLDERADRYIDHTVQGVTRMQALIDDLLGYSRAGRGAPARTPVDCEKLVAGVIEGLAPAIRSSRAVVDVDPLPQVTGDAPKLAQVFQNLIATGLRFTDGRAPRVAVSAAEGPGEWVFSVADNGIGVAPEHAERIFRMFQGLHRRKLHEGTGIGLALCKRIVEAHGGHIWLEPSETEGSVSSFSLPKG